MITILLVGVCLNLSAFHSHFLITYPDSEKGDIPHHVKEEMPVCFACLHLAAGILSNTESRVISADFGKTGLFISIEAETDFTPASVSNKSPPPFQVSRL